MNEVEAMLTFMGVNRSSFGEFTLSGGRFDGTSGLPVDALNELQNYKALIVDVAASLYRGEHPEKKILPAGFRSKLDLRIQEIREGCVIVDLDYEVKENVQETLDGEEGDYFGKARDVTEKAMNHIKEKKPLDGSFNFPREDMRRLLSFGETLHDDEKLTFGSGNGEVAVNDKDFRELAAQFKEQESEDVVLQGYVIGVTSNASGNSSKYTFLQADSGEVRKAQIPEGKWEDFARFLARGKKGTLVSLSVSLWTQETLKETHIEKTYSIEPALPEDMSGRIAELGELQDGWFGPGSESKAVSKAALDEAEILLQAGMDSAIQAPIITPTLQGGVQIEWDDNDYELVISVTGETTAYNLSDERDDDGEKVFPRNGDPMQVFEWLEKGEVDSDGVA